MYVFFFLEMFCGYIVNFYFGIVNLVFTCIYYLDCMDVML